MHTLPDQNEFPKELKRLAIKLEDITSDLLDMASSLEDPDGQD